jgi:uncharacterized membrane protein YeaQ/YmgE (transglycosylase-associated protein family)
MTMGIIAWIIIGGLAGWIGSKIMKTDASMGIILNIVVGVIGGLLGGWLLKLFGVDVEGGGLIFSFLDCARSLLPGLLTYCVKPRQCPFRSLHTRVQRGAKWHAVPPRSVNRPAPEWLTLPTW